MSHLKLLAPLAFDSVDASAQSQKNLAHTLNISGLDEHYDMSFGIYVVGYLIFTLGLALGAHLLNVPPQWIGVGALCLIGIGIIHGVTATRQKDSP